MVFDTNQRVQTSGMRKSLRILPINFSGERSEFGELKMYQSRFKKHVAKSYDLAFSWFCQVFVRILTQMSGCLLSSSKEEFSAID